ncbi:MAG: Tim44 domain-containing protein [Nitrospiria bacterium]
MKMKWTIVTLSLVLMTTLFFESTSFARAGGARSMGSRGSRAYSTPAAPFQQTVRPTQPSPQPTPPVTSSGFFGGGFGRSLMGGLMGGFLGGLLFRSLGFAGDGLGQSGIGLFEILLLVGIGLGIFWWIKRRSSLAYAPAGVSSSSWNVPSSSPESSPMEKGGLTSVPSLEEGLRAIQAMDPQFQINQFKDMVTETFFKIQIGWGKKNLSHCFSLMTPEMNTTFEREIGRLKVENKTNHLENISLRSVEPVEAWQETGNDFITTLISANLLDYTKDDQTGAVISGSDAEPVSFKEYWTFTRPVGNGAWVLSAIQQV